MRTMALLIGMSLTLAAGTPSIGAAAPDASCTGKTGKAGSFELTLQSGGLTRNYRLHVPPSYNPAAPTPLILSFHGVTSSGKEMEDVSHAIETSDKNGFIIAHPDGYGASWNAGWCCAPATTTNVDDVQFARDLVAAIASNYCVDTARTFAMGFSNGGFMSHRLGCEAADLFAAIGPHSGEIAVQECKPSRPLPVIQTHGTADAVVPYKTGEWSIQKWAEFNGCDINTTTIYQKGTASCILYPLCPANANVEFCSVKRMGHTWATWTNTNGNIDSMDFYWDFFKAHPKP